MTEDTVTVDTDEGDVVEAKSVWPPTDDSFSRDDLLEGVWDRINNIEADPREAVEIAVDTTFQYVVDWLHERGNIGPAAVLADRTGVDE